MTVYENRYFKFLMRGLASMVFKLSGWKTEGEKPHFNRYVIIAAPHTSNWDFLYTLCLVLIFDIKPVIMMKDFWFFWPLGPFFRWIGAVPVDRSVSTNATARMAGLFKKRDEMVLILAPTGTRKNARWKTGFYYIAREAGVPVVPGFLDYKRKVGGVGPCFHLAGNIENDMLRIKNFYRGVSGKNRVEDGASNPA